MTSARTSWNLSPEDLLDHGCPPSLWRIQNTALLILVSLIIGPLRLDRLAGGDPHVHRCMAATKRNRKTAVRYPVRPLI